MYTFVLFLLLACTGPDEAKEPDDSASEPADADTDVDTDTEADSDDTSGEDTDDTASDRPDVLEDCIEYAGRSIRRCAASDPDMILSCELTDGAYVWIVDEFCVGGGDPWREDICWETAGGGSAECGCPTVGESYCLDDEERIYTCGEDGGTAPAWEYSDTESLRRNFANHSADWHDESGSRQRGMADRVREQIEEYAVQCVCNEAGTGFECSCSPGASLCQTEDEAGASNCGQWICDDSGEFFYAQAPGNDCECD
ncbi:MAG: hypothetical protein Q8P41_02280 [Pseudomonadota bacterium]|nr:hypothetical protein [Pseudomonadota bacterium]